MEKDNILDVWAISRELNCSPATVRRMIKKNMLPHYRLGIRIYTKKSYLDAWIHKQITKSTTESHHEY
ncbi:helix-turn-helix domain-containing protein [Paenibacillus sp. FSL F4-0122]|uniref:helix-turn-helix domain-containing protein n=1 Tax=Paenibacillus sp. FSL F4-0122 TaxID=2921371 RepID=UPI004046904F